MRRVLLASLVIVVAVMSGGCYEFNAFVHRPFGPGTLCDPTHCGSCDPCGYDRCGRGPCGVGPYFGTWGFGPTWGYGPAAGCRPGYDAQAGCGDGSGPSCGPACGECGPACGPSCGGGCTCGCCVGGCTCGCGCAGYGPGPIMCVLSLFRPVKWTGCHHSGCGEIYWGDFHGDPPDCCDPCDRMGNFTGCTDSPSCDCAGRPPTSDGTPSVAPSSPERIDPGRAQPTKAPPRTPPGSFLSRRYHKTPRQ